MMLRRCSSGSCCCGPVIAITVFTAAFLLTTNCNAFTSPDLLQQTSSRHKLSTIQHQPLIKTARYGFKEYPKEFDHTNDGSSDNNQQSKYNGPSPEFYKKMGLSEGQPPPQQAPRMQQQQQQPQANTPPPQQFYDANGNPVTTTPMVYDANGNLVPFTLPPPPVQQQMQQPPAVSSASAVKAPQFVPNTPSSIEPPLPTTRTKSTPDSPRPVGYNADAYAVSNTADVYFAQLKQDSKIRKIARLKGDYETSEKVFGDVSVKEIGDSWNSNPYTKE